MKYSRTHSFPSLAAFRIGPRRLQLCPIAGISLLLLWGSSAFGTIQPISNVLLDPAVSSFPSSEVDDDAELKEFDVGSTGYTVDDILSVSDVTPGATFNKRFFADNGTDPLTRENALSDNLITSGVGNPSEIIGQFSRTVSATDQIFITEFGGNDTIGIEPQFDGVAIGNYSLTIQSTDWSAALFDYDGKFGSSTAQLDGVIAGVAFQRGDFTGTTGDITTMNGMKITASGLDPTLIGLAVVPEPNFLPLAACILLATLFRRKARSRRSD